MKLNIDLTKIEDFNDLLEHLTDFKDSNFPLNNCQNINIDGLNAEFKYRKGNNTFPIMLRESKELLFIDPITKKNAIQLSIRPHSASNKIRSIIEASSLPKITPSKKHSCCPEDYYRFQLADKIPNSEEKKELTKMVKQILKSIGSKFC